MLKAALFSSNADNPKYAARFPFCESALFSTFVKWLVCFCSVYAFTVRGNGAEAEGIRSKGLCSGAEVQSGRHKGHSNWM
jgi:hypothetical protein